MEKRFGLSYESHIWLYGAASAGTIMCRYLEEQGFFVEGFIDRRAYEIGSLLEKKVITIEETGNLGEDKIVIVAVKNVFEHERIAIELMKQGITNIVYFPYNALTGNADEREKELYEISNVLSKREKITPLYLPKTWKIKETILKDELQIRSNGEKIVVRVPVGLVFTDKLYKTEKLLNQKVHSQENFLDKNILFLKPHINFFKFLFGDVSADYQEYIALCETAAKNIDTFQCTEAWRSNVFRNRVEVFENMQKEYQRKSDFFVDGAPNAEWNPKGYFNLRSGKHRAAFLVAKNEFYIPLCISREDYTNYLNMPEVENLKDYFNNQEITYLRQPIEHPYFDGMLCLDRSFWTNLLFALASHIDFRKVTSVFIDVDDCGWLCRFFWRCGIKVGKKIISNTIEIENRLNALFGCHGTNYVSEETDCSEYDIVITNDGKKVNKIDTHIFYMSTEKSELECVMSGCCGGKPMYIYHK